MEKKYKKQINKKQQDNQKQTEAKPLISEISVNIFFIMRTKKLSKYTKKRIRLE